MSLLITNPLYGRVRITEPVLIDLLKSPALHRLKYIQQSGAWQFHDTTDLAFSRHIHSVGVMLLLRRFGASVEEQIAGLLHDISHTAFSHVADFVFNSHLEHDYQDRKLEKAFELQGLNKILLTHRINPAYILNHDHFPLLEQDLPDLCADRIDYTLQDPAGKRLGFKTQRQILSQLTVHNKRFVFKNKKAAQQFARLNLTLNKKRWCNPLEIALYELLARAIKVALQKQIIYKRDLFTTDKVVTKKLRHSKDTEITMLLNLLKTLRIRVVQKTDADIFSRSKPRAVDPPFLSNGRLLKLSSVDTPYNRAMKKFVVEAKRGVGIKLLSNKNKLSRVW